MERPDGYPRLGEGLRPEFRGRSRASWIWACSIARCKEKQVDVVAGNSTDGLIAALGMVVLEDDRHYFPPYQAVTVVRAATLRALTRNCAALLDALGGKISDRKCAR